MFLSLFCAFFFLSSISAQSVETVDLSEPIVDSHVDFSHVNCDSNSTFNITPSNSSDVFSHPVKSLLISNLALENGSSLSITTMNPESHTLLITGEGTASLPILFLDTNLTHTVRYYRAPNCTNSSTSPDSYQLFSDAECNAVFYFNVTSSQVAFPNFIITLSISNLVLEKNSSLTITALSPPYHNLIISGEGASSLPTLLLNGDTTYSVAYARTFFCSKTPRTLLSASWATVTNDACAPINLDKKQSFKSPNYPSNYPLLEFNANIQCRNVNSSSSFIYVTFKDVDLADGHILEFSDNTGSINVTKKTVPGDVIVSSKTVINFLRSFDPFPNTRRNITDQLSGRGFDIDLEALNCGGEIEKESGEMYTLNGTKNIDRCIWILRTPVDQNNLKVLNFSIFPLIEDMIIHDSDTLKNNQTIKLEAGYLNSTSETIIIEYSANKTVYLNWTTFVCPDRCLGIHRCINPSERCNGANDCGDWSDELHCNGSAPVPPPKTETSTGVPGLVVVFVIIPMAIIIGILGTLFLPKLVARIRDRRYQEFREYSDVS